MSTFARATVTQEFLDDMYGRIARRYDLVNSVQSFGLVGFVRREVAGWAARGVVLDAGAGSGYLAAACLAGGASRVVCLDRSPPMFDVARRKLGAFERTGRVFFVLGDVTRLPFRDGAFDNAASAFLFRNVPRVDAAVKEIKRVVKAGGRAAVADVFAPPGGFIGALYRSYLNVVVPLWGRLLAGDGPAYRYLSSSIRHCFSAEDFARCLAAAGFGDVSARPKFCGVVYVVKARTPWPGEILN